MQGAAARRGTLGGLSVLQDGTNQNRQEERRHNATFVRLRTTNGLHLVAHLQKVNSEGNQVEHPNRQVLLAEYLQVLVR